MTRISRCSGLIGSSMHGIRDLQGDNSIKSRRFGYLFRSTFEGDLVGLPDKPVMQK
jgi:hypothetical protein